MPLFEVGDDKLTPFRQRRGGADLYEREIEDLLWANLEDFTGEGLFRVRRQPTLSGGGRPDIVALDRQGAVVVIEVKRDVDRNQLAQCLEYAGWARTTHLDELAGMYHAGPDRFWKDWLEFTESSVPVRVLRAPRLLLIAREFHGRTASALEFLVENKLPVRLIRVALYEDEAGRKFVDVEGEHEVEFSAVLPLPAIDGHGIRLADLIEDGLLAPGTPLIWDRPRLGQRYEAEVSAEGAITLSTGGTFSSPSRAAIEAAGIAAYDGWLAWRVQSPTGPLLNELRIRLAEQRAADVQQAGPGA